MLVGRSGLKNLYLLQLLDELPWTGSGLVLQYKKICFFLFTYSYKCLRMMVRRGEIPMILGIPWVFVCWIDFWYTCTYVLIMMNGNNSVLYITSPLVIMTGDFMYDVITAKWHCHQLQPSFVYSQLANTNIIPSPHISIVSWHDTSMAASL